MTEKHGGSNMTRFGSGLIALSLVVGAAQIAVAADVPGAYGVPVLRAPSAIVAANWDGFYVGGNLGGIFSSSTYTLNNGVISQNFNFDPASFIGGGQMGLQAQWGHWVFGLEGSYSWTSLTNNQTIGTTLAITDIKYLGALSGRIGWAESRWMAYGKAGWAFARTHTFDSDSSTSFNVDTRKWDNGFVLGLGFDYLLTPSWIAGFAFDYYHFTPTRTFPVGGISNGDFDLFSLTARLTYLFNWY
jgi:outer membrane immunogenic protein